MTKGGAADPRPIGRGQREFPVVVAVDYRPGVTRAAEAIGRSVVKADGATRVAVEGEHLFMHLGLLRPWAHANSLRSLARRLTRARPSGGGAERWAGIGYPLHEHDPGGTRERALRALQLGRQVWVRPRVVLYEELLPFEALLRDPEGTARLARAVDPLVSYDAAQGTELLRTVELLAESDFSLSAAARHLGIHRHTLTSRVLIADGLLGRSVRTGPDRLLIELASKARRLLPSAGG